MLKKKLMSWMKRKKSRRFFDFKLFNNKW
jgi:hypothetical protein